MGIIRTILENEKLRLYIGQCIAIEMNYGFLIY